MNVIFSMKIYRETSNYLSYKLIPLILDGVARSAQITQNNKFAKSLQYRKKK